MASNASIIALNPEQLSRVLSEWAVGTLRYYGAGPCVAEAALLEPLDGRTTTRCRRDNYSCGDDDIYRAPSADSLLRALEERGLA